MLTYEPVGWLDHIRDDITGEVIQEGTPLSQRNLNHMDGGIAAATRGLNDYERETESIRKELQVLKDATLNNMTNNVFLDQFEDLDDVEVSGGIYEPATHRIYV